MKKNKLSATEQANPRTRGLDRLPTRKILEAMNREDALVAAAVRRELPNITKAVNAIVAALEIGGRLFYVGAGTSGRLGVLDAAEIPPTFQFPARRVQGVIAGGSRALRRSVEGAEDSEAAGARDIRKHGLKKGDVVVGLAASGTTPYVVGALARAKKTGAFTIAVTVSPGSPVAKKARVVICPVTGPEVIAGSTRLKAGTAQKLVLNMLSTAKRSAAVLRHGHGRLSAPPVGT
jgi:N-acetylmuramic acid 6-phosphate etherase